MAVTAAFGRGTDDGDALASPPAALLSGPPSNSRVSDEIAALSGYNSKAPGFAGGYLQRRGSEAAPIADNEAAAAAERDLFT